MARRKKCPGYLQKRGRQSGRWLMGIGAKLKSFTIHAETKGQAAAWARKKYAELEASIGSLGESATVGGEVLTL